MTSAFRTTALAAALAAFSCGAFAAPVVISLNFEAQGAAALLADEPVPVSVDSDVYFQGAWAYEWNMLGINDPKPANDNQGGFVVNRSRDFITNDIVMSLEDLTLAAARAAGTTAFPGQFFTSITFSLFTAGLTPKAIYTDANGVERTKQLTPGSSDLLWSTNVVTFDALDQVRSLVFVASQGAVLGLDNLTITLSEAPDGGNVPEPASYALVGLALLAAGSASRRRA